MLEFIKALFGMKPKTYTQNCPYEIEIKEDFVEPYEATATEPVNEEDNMVQKVKELRSNGKSFKVIASELNLTEYKVKKYLKA
jgi:DNA-binding NarL/FixJ family response regulator